MKRLLSILIVIFLMGGCASKKQTETAGEKAAKLEPPKKFRKYKNDAKGFEIYYPKDWYRSQQMSTATISFVSPLSSNEDAARENCGVSSVDLPGPISLGRFYELNLKQLRRLMTDFEEHGSQTVTVRGRDAIRAEFSHRMGQENFRVLFYVLTGGQRGYSITCTAVPETFDEFEGTFKKIAGTFAYF